jgi:hypothetical protein
MLNAYALNDNACLTPRGVTASELRSFVLLLTRLCRSSPGCLKY